MMKNTINTELIIGLFMIAGFLAFGYLSLQMGEFSIFDLEKTYSLARSIIEVRIFLNLFTKRFRMVWTLPSILLVEPIFAALIKL